MMQVAISSAVDQTVDKKVKIKNTQPVEEALIDMLKCGYTAVSANLENASYQYIKNELTNKTFKSILYDLPKRKLER